VIKGSKRTDRWQEREPLQQQQEQQEQQQQQQPDHPEETIKSPVKYNKSAMKCGSCLNEPTNERINFNLYFTATDVRRRKRNNNNNRCNNTAPAEQHSAQDCTPKTRI